MRTVKCQGFDDAVNRLQEYVDRYWHAHLGFKANELEKRKWLKTVPQDSYGDKHYRVELWVLEGSPAKQIVVINHYMKEILCFSGSLVKEVRFVWDWKFMYG